MAFTQRELEISNKSYTNKDFAAIYEELLTTAEKLSKRFSPTTAVETDPFVVVLKLAAIVADKVIYNVDKNILERFISSCTQQQSMRELTETLGYNMHYYRAAETSITCTYKSSNELSSSINIPKYTVVESASKIPYVTTMHSFIDKNTKTSGEIPVIQGKIQSLTVLGSAIIQLENLNSNKRLYFPELMVAENGVFISNNIPEDWERVDNLNTQIYGSTKYKFGFDSKRNLPYVEFPDWIADIIGEGLTINYIVTQGQVGNVAAKELTTIKKRAVDDTIDNNDIRVVNLSAAYSGADPETLDESYLGFKRVIGTFDTLTTCRDYANAIYNMSGPIVSNVQVADRRTDINYACDVATFDPSLGVVTESMPMESITPFDLVVYPLSPIIGTTVSNIKANADRYNKSFTLLDQPKINNITTDLETNAQYKTISHTFKTLADGDITTIQNLYSLTATVNTVAKVNVLEQADIISNIQIALAREFNSRKLSFGHELSYDELLAVMENADARIKSVSLQEPIQTPKIITRTGVAPTWSEEISDLHTYDNITGLPDGDTEIFKFIVAKNVLGGRAALFEYDSDFSYSYDYSNIDPIPNIKRITTTCNIDPIEASESYILKANEVVQFLAPNLLTDNVYTAGVYYYLKLTAGTSIPANIDYQLKADDILKFYYKQDGIWKNDIIELGKIINSKTELFTTAYLLTPGNDSRIKDITFNSNDYHGLTSGQEVTIKKINSEEVTQAKKCYWITNAVDNEIKWNNTQEYILQENEYFFYSDINLTTLYAFGSGTKLTISSGMTGWDWKCKDDINIDDITLEGLYALNDAFKLVEFKADRKLTIIENEILTLTEGDTINNVSTGSPAPAFNVSNNAFVDIMDVALEYKYKTTETLIPLPDRSTITGANWSCRAVLDLNCGPELEQELEGNQEVYYSIDNDIIIDSEDPGDDSYTGVFTAAAHQVIKFNILMQRGGGENLNLGYITINNLEEEIYPTLLSVTKESDCAINQTADGMYVPEFTDDDVAKFYAAPVDGATPYVMIFGKGVVTGQEPAVQAYNNTTPLEGTAFEINQGINIIELKDVSTTATHWQLTRYPDSEVTFIVSPIKYVKGINPLLGLKTSLPQFIDYMETEFDEQYANFYSLADLDPSKEIELSAAVKLDTAQAFYDSNNIANRWVLPKIDFSAIDIKIARNSSK